jgi:hypothetical protein
MARQESGGEKEKAYNISFKEKEDEGSSVVIVGHYARPAAFVSLRLLAGRS